MTARKPRVLRALVVPFHKPLHTSYGIVAFGPGQIRVAEDVSRVKLLLEHERGTVLAAGAAVEETPVGLFVEFEEAHTNECRAAFDSAAAGLRDGVSPGLELDPATRTRITRAGARLSVAGSGVLREVSLVAVPAHDDARVVEVRR